MSIKDQQTVSLPQPEEFLRQGANAWPHIVEALDSYPVSQLAAIERLRHWADSLLQNPDFRPVPPQEPRDLQAAPLIFLSRWFERLADGKRALELLSCPQLATTDTEIEAYLLLWRAQLHFGLGQVHESSSALRHSILLMESPALLRKAANLAEKILDREEIGSHPECRLALIGDITFTNYTPSLKAYGFARRLRLKLHFGSFGQQFQELVSPESELARFQPSIIAIASTWRSLGIAEDEADPAAVVERVLNGCREMWSFAKQRGASLVIQHNFEIPEHSPYGHLSFNLPGGRANILRSINLQLQKAASETPGVFVLDVEHLAASIGKQSWADDRLWTAAKHYPSSAGTTLIARHQIAVARAFHAGPAKCLVLDLDNTLWGGVIGEDGLTGIRLGGTAEGEAYVAFQRYVKSLGDRGIFLAVCSKNDDDDAKSPFLKHPEMVLKLDDVSVFLANWKPKHENLKQIAADLNIGIDSLVFVDDNPLERTAVRALLPEVEVPEVGSDPLQFGAAISRGLCFESLAVTREDRLRVTSYKASATLRSLSQNSGALDTYLNALGMRISLLPLNEVNLPRAMQLIAKTNQFNLTTSRMDESRVRGYMTEGNYARLIHLTDVYADHGITGLMLAKSSGDVLSIDEWLLSCRILGRRVEEAMFSAVWNHALTTGISQLRATFKRTAKNSQVEDLYDRLGMSLLESTDSSKVYQAELNSEKAMPDCFSIAEHPQLINTKAMVESAN